MYEAHFGLSRRPFAETTDPAAYLPLASREAVSRRVRYGLVHGQGPALIYGPPGSGKTLLARTIAADEGHPATLLTFPALPAAELLAYLADALGAPSDDPSPAPPQVGKSLRRLGNRLATLVQSGESPLLVVDEAHLIDDPSTFETLRAALNFATLGPPDLRLLLVGGLDLPARLPDSFADRLTATCLLGALTLTETGDYLHGRLVHAGVHPADRLFAPDAVAALHHAADGSPRRLNRLADLALLVAYADNRPKPDARSVEVALRDNDRAHFAA